MDYRVTYKGIDYENLKIKYDQVLAERDALYIDHKKKDHVIDALKSELIAARDALNNIWDCQDCGPNYCKTCDNTSKQALARIDKFLGEKEFSNDPYGDKIPEG